MLLAFMYLEVLRILYNKLTEREEREGEREGWREKGREREREITSRKYIVHFYYENYLLISFILNLILNHPAIAFSFTKY